MPDYQKGKIYSIRSHQTEEIYIGSTTQTLFARLASHKRDYRHYKKCKKGYVISSFHILQFDDAYIELYENYPCNNKNELTKREGEIIRELNCVNKLIPGRTLKEYYIDNKDKILNQKKEYYRNNKDKILKYHREERYRDNKDKILKQNKEYRKANKEKILKYAEEYYRNNKEKIQEYYRNNKEKIAERRKEYAGEYYRNNKEKIQERYRNNRDKILKQKKEYRERIKDSKEKKDVPEN